MTREELAALAAKYGSEPEVTDPVAYINDLTRTLVLVNEQFYHWDPATQDFVEV